MGTTAPYGGSGGRDWKKLREGVENWLDSLPGAGEEVPGDEGGGGNGDEEGDQGRPGQPDQTTLPDLVGAFGRAFQSGGGSSDGPSAGGGIGSRGGTGTSSGRSPSGTGRSPALAGRVGGRLAVGIVGMRAGDGTALDAIGIDFAEMQGLDTYGQAQMLVRAATENSVATSMEDEEIQAASNKTAIWALERNDAPEANEVVQRFITEYVYRVFLTESGSILRSGSRDGVAAVAAEKQIWETIEALVRGFPLRSTGMGPVELGGAAEKVLKQVLQIHAGEGDS